jgi:5S rRNA maturation endonuclease (ribonuclease M5)
MSNVLHGNCNYFQVPQELLAAGALSAMGGSDLKLYLALLYEAQRTTSTEIQLNGQKLQGMTGLSAGSATDARKRLTARGLVQAKRGLGNAYVYKLLEPSSGEPMRNFKREGGKQSSTSLRRDAGWLYALTPEQYELYYRTRLEGSLITKTRNGLSATCPFHSDNHPSLSIATRTGVWNCHRCDKGGGMIQFERAVKEVDAATAVRNIASIVGVDLSNVRQYQEPENTYSYCDEHGELLYEVLRYPGKGFSVRRPDPESGGWLTEAGDVRRVLYRLPQIQDASQVIITEGEKDADAITDLHLLARDGSEVIGTTSPFGAGKWLDEYQESLRDRDVIVMPDMDENGLRHAEQVYRSLDGIAATLRQVNIPSEAGVKDVSDYLQRMGEEELVNLIGADWFGGECFVEA